VRQDKVWRFQRVKIPRRQGVSHPTGNRVLDAVRMSTTPCGSQICGADGKTQFLMVNETTPQSIMTAAKGRMETVRMEVARRRPGHIE
jgi:hypothetical protein